VRRNFGYKRLSMKHWLDSPVRAIQMAPEMNHVLFLCSGNYYRSRFAEYLFNWLAECTGLPWRADSRGLGVDRAGNIGPISHYTIERLRTLAIPTVGDFRFPRQLSDADLVASDLVIAMKEAEHRPLLANLFLSWEDQVEYWHVDDLDCAEPEEALTAVENEVRALVGLLDEGRRPPTGIWKTAISPIAANLSFS
jgi:protein-tyrosine phosphatase